MGDRDGGLPEGALAVAGGPLGRHASARATSWVATVVPLVAASAATMALSVAQRAHCIQQGWNGSDQFWHACFSDLPSTYQLGNLQDGVLSYLTGGGASADHPPLTGLLLAAIGETVPSGTFLSQTRWFFGVWALLATVLAAWTVWLTAASRPRHARAAAQVALSPVLLLAAPIAPDLFGVTLASAGIWAWSRRRPALAGALLGLAVMARTYPLLILLALVLLGLRTGRLEAVARALLAAVGAAVVVALPFVVANPEAVLGPVRTWWQAPAGLGSVWMLPQLAGHPLPVGVANLLVCVGLVLTVLVGALFALGTVRRPTLAEVALVLVAGALLTGKAFPVQSSLWLVPLVALCGVRWRDHLVWACAEALHFVAVWMYVAGLSTPDRGLRPGWYAVFLVLRVAGVVYLAWRVGRRAADRAAYPRLSSPQDAQSSEDPADQGAADAPKTSPGPDPSGDAVTDELAGDFADSRDSLLVRLT